MSDIRDDLLAAAEHWKARAEAAERERDDWREKCRAANRQRSRVWNLAERSRGIEERLGAVTEALSTEQAQHALTKRGHVNATEWIVALIEEKSATERELAAAREREERLREALLGQTVYRTADGIPCWCGNFDEVAAGKTNGNHSPRCRDARAALSASPSPARASRGTGGDRE